MSRVVVPLLLLVGVVCVESEGAIIASARGRAKTSLTARISINTRGQRQIAITIDPSVTTAFQLDFAYPAKSVTPVDFGGFNVSLATTAIEYIAPYVGGPSSAMLVGGQTPADGIIADITGQLAATALPPGPNNPNGGSDLFTLYFIDNDPLTDKVFVLPGFDGKGVPPEYSRFVADNFIEGVIDGQTVRFEGDQIEGAVLVVPGVDPNAVPLPAGVWVGMVLGVLVLGIGQKKFKVPSS